MVSQLNGSDLEGLLQGEGCGVFIDHDFYLHSFRNLKSIDGQSNVNALKWIIQSEGCGMLMEINWDILEAETTEIAMNAPTVANFFDRRNTQDVLKTS